MGCITMSYVSGILNKGDLVLQLLAIPDAVDRFVMQGSQKATPTSVGVWLFWDERLATRTGFEPVISGLTGQCVKPLHHRAVY